MRPRRGQRRRTVDYTLQRSIEQLDRRKPREAREELRRYEKELVEAWKKPSRQESFLAFLLRSDVPIKDIAKLLRASRRGGKPAHTRWLSQDQIIAWLVEGKLRARVAHSENELISHFIEFTNTWWAFRRGARPLNPEIGGRDHERIKALLRRPKRRRL